MNEIILQEINAGFKERMRLASLTSLIFDSVRCHISENAKSRLPNLKIVLIPGGLTKLLQPLNTLTNKSFKNKLRLCWERFIVDISNHTYTASGRMRQATYQQICT